jgi:hypothetical protein
MAPFEGGVPQTYIIFRDLTPLIKIDYLFWNVTFATYMKTHKFRVSHMKNRWLNANVPIQALYKTNTRALWWMSFPASRFFSFCHQY